ncbi:MAG: hypothetical protein WC755_01630 [Candidatus Woesearchaeota archaeon]|jgi:hypothetical protein
MARPTWDTLENKKGIKMELVLNNILCIIISYVAIYCGIILGKYTNDEVKYNNYINIHVILFVLFSALCFALNYYIAILLILMCFLLFKTSYAYNLMFLIVGVSVVFSKWFVFAVSIATIYGLVYGAIMQSKKKSLFWNSLGYVIGILVCVLIKVIIL